jgi:hypothetical protein
LRPVDPEEGFEQRVLARIVQGAVKHSQESHALGLRGAAASVVFAAVLGTHEWQLRREQEGLEARKQLLEALRLTGEKLDVAYQAVNREAPEPADDGSGA